MQIRPSTPLSPPPPSPSEEEEEIQVVQQQQVVIVPRTMADVTAPIQISRTVEIASVSPLSLDEEEYDQKSRFSSSSSCYDFDAPDTTSISMTAVAFDYGVHLPPKRRVKKVLIRPVPLHPPTH